MGIKYIIEVEDKPFELLSEDGFTSEKLFRVKGFNSLVFDWNGLNMLTPYTEPDTEQVRKKAYDKCMNEAEDLAYKLYSPKIDEAYQRGLNDAWEAARKICLEDDDGGIPASAINDIFSVRNYRNALRDFSVSEAIEKIRQYEQEKDRQARIEYNFDEVKDVIETTAKEYNMSLDEIAEVLKKMGEH